MVRGTTVDAALREAYREERSIEKGGEATYASRLRAGETLFFEGRDQTSFGYQTRMAARIGGRLVTRKSTVDGRPGILVWVTFGDGAPSRGVTGVNSDAR